MLEGARGDHRAALELSPRTLNCTSADWLGMSGTAGIDQMAAVPEMTTVFAGPGTRGRDGHRTLGLHLLAAGFLAGIPTDLVVSYGGG